MPWASGEETGQPLAERPSEPNPAAVKKKKKVSVTTNNLATFITEYIDLIGCPFLFYPIGATIGLVEE
jgi:hypothetical protein